MMDHDFLGEAAVPPTYTRTYGGNAAFHNFHNDYSHIQDPNLRRRLALSEVWMLSQQATLLPAL
jgi:MFS transporter, PHS family, inorganic phosphate transporter